MSRVIYKFPLKLGLHQEVRVYGDDAKVVSVGHQGGGELQIWIEQDKDKDFHTMTFSVIGTGHDVPEGYQHVGTVHTEIFFVWHIYQKVSET